MTTIDAAAARNVRKTIACAAIAAFLALGVTGCSTSGGNILQSLTGDPTTNQTAATTAPISAASTKGRVAIAPIIGPPNNISSQLTAQLTAALAQKGVAVVTSQAGAAAQTGADYTLRGYVVAAKESAGIEVSYIWDVANPGGHRVNRITGKEIVTGAKTADPWSSVSAPILQQIATKTATNLGAWMPSKTPAAAAPASAVPVASAAPAATPKPTKAAVAPTRTASTATGSTNAATTGSIPRSSGLAVVVPRVTGAPGDGSTSLALALQKELTKNGIKLATGGGSSGAHRVEGKVAVGANKNGKQPISIDWVVKDPRGNKLGTVSQKNEIPAGSLSGKWGATAGAAAAAAAQGIVRLLPRKTASR
ncbi:MAG: hypothetical protein ACR2PA_03935 [Hyphomicrobiaceae bacterium]